MRPTDVYKLLSENKVNGNLVFDGKAFPIAVGEDDGRASQLILMLEEYMPELTIQEALDMLDAARWWLTFWASVSKASTLEEA